MSDSYEKEKRRRPCEVPKCENSAEWFFSLETGKHYFCSECGVNLMNALVLNGKIVRPQLIDDEEEEEA